MGASGSDASNSRSCGARIFADECDPDRWGKSYHPPNCAPPRRCGQRDRPDPGAKAFAPCARREGRRQNWPLSSERPEDLLRDGTGKLLLHLAKGVGDDAAAYAEDLLL